LPKFDLEAELTRWRSLGQCLERGDLVLSPFEQPIEEERRGDPDQTDDNSNFSTDNVCVLSEPRIPGNKKSIRGACVDPMFRYFLDGSIRTKYVGEYVEGRLSFPLIVSEIAVAVMERIQKSLRPSTLRKNLYFIFPHKDSGLIADTTYDRINQIRERWVRESSLTCIEFLKRAEISGDPRFAFLGKVRSLMHDMEHEVAKSLTRSEDDWLVMDGAMRKEEFLNLPSAIGLAKSFSRKPVFSIDDALITLSAYMRTIGEGERSAVFRKQNPSGKVERDVAFWYLRVRSYPPMEPLGGIVKIDLNVPGETVLTAEQVRLVDRISAAVYSMRFPSVYPWPRWPSYVYPIRLAEVLMSSAFFSSYYLLQVGEELKAATRIGQSDG